MITVDPQISRHQISASVSRGFSLGTDFFNVILSHLSGISRSGYGRSVFTIKCIFTLYFGSIIRTVDFDELGVNCCKNTGLAFCFYKTMCDNM